VLGAIVANLALAQGAEGRTPMMRYAIIVFGLVLLLAAGCAQNDSGTTTRAGVTWLSSLPDARRLASREHRPLLVVFSASWCGPCQEMKNETFVSPTVTPLLSSMVCVDVDADANQDAVREYKIDAIPRTMLFRSSDSSCLMDQTGFQDPDAFAQALRDALKHKAGGV
jgi:thiol:disulfide interchange protein